MLRSSEPNTDLCSNMLLTQVYLSSTDLVPVGLVLNFLQNEH